MDIRPLAMRITGMLLLWLLSVAPDLFASATEPPSRQTEFNEQNYQPSRQINVSAPVQARPARARPAPEQREVRSNTEKVIWTNARGAQAQYQVYYEHDRSHITFASVCSNYRKGSIDYRNCRKAAKQWFGNRCNNSSGAGRMYCQASNAFRP